MIAFNKFRFGYWVPAAVLLIGSLAFVLLLWADRLGDTLRNEADIVDAVMDAQINTSAAHLWLEHAIHGIASLETGKIIAELDRAIGLIDVTLQGGQAEHDWIAEPLDDPEIRARAQEIRVLLTTLKELAQERLRHPEASGFGTEIHQRYDSVFREITTKARALEAALEKQEVRNVETFRTLFQWVLVIWGVIVVVATVTLRRFEYQRWKFKEELLEANQRLHTQTEELNAHRDRLTELVAARTAELQAANQQLQAEMVDRLHACELLRSTEAQNRHLSTRLLWAQEIERKRISMELHDGLGQALSIVKLRLRAIEKTLGKDQKSQRDDCEQLLDYLNHVIDEVRRLALAMSPTTLEDLGLTAALQWLVGNLAKLAQPAVTADIVGIDHLLPRDQWITVYRVVQEILNNVLKHAQAEHLAVVVRRRNSTIDFAFEDDGQGFDAERILEKGADPRGFGLQTMTERVKMLDGMLELWSQPGKGTRITFSIPLATGGG